MRTLLIADDERTIREGIARSINWESLGITKILLAADGKEAYEIITKEQPDIAIIDIIMPEMTGLEVIARIHNTEQGPEFIIVSGHDEFDYAQEAIDYNVHNYILKPCDATEITAAVEGILRTLERRESILDQQQRLKEYVARLMPQAQEQIISNFLLDGSKGRDLLTRIIHETDRNQLLLLSVSDPDDYPKLPTLRRCVDENTEALGWSLSVMLREGIVVIFKGKAEAQVKDIVQRICAASKNQGIESVRAAISGSGLLDELPQLYREVCKVIRHIPPGKPDQLPLIDAASVQYSMAVRKTIQYIKEHLDDHALSLHHIATNVLYLNPDYLGKLFKKECGTKFSDYLLMLRMEKAKQLIAMSPDVKIYEVAQQVGLGDNPAYFGQIFKKYTGVLPSDYRELQMGSIMPVAERP